MDVNYRKPKKLTPKEREVWFKEGQCLQCQKKGHMAIACPLGTSLDKTPPLLTRSPAHPPTKKVAIIETTVSVEEVEEEDTE